MCWVVFCHVLPPSMHSKSIKGMGNPLNRSPNILGIALHKNGCCCAPFCCMFSFSFLFARATHKQIVQSLTLCIRVVSGVLSRFKKQSKITNRNVCVPPVPPRANSRLSCSSLSWVKRKNKKKSIVSTTYRNC